MADINDRDTVEKGENGDGANKPPLPKGNGHISHSRDEMHHEDEPNFSTRTNTSQQEFLDEVKRFELFRTVIQHEDDLLNQRVSWIILAQSFLMAAFIICAAIVECPQL